MTCRTGCAAAAAVLLAAGCGGSAKAPPATVAAGHSTTAAGATALTFTLVPGFVGSGEGPKSFTLRCDPPRGTVRDAAAACARLAAAPDLLAPLGTCQEHLADAPVQRARGTFRGQPVQLLFDACRLHRERWLKLAAALGVDG